MEWKQEKQTILSISGDLRNVSVLITETELNLTQDNWVNFSISIGVENQSEVTRLLCAIVFLQTVKWVVQEELS